MPTTLIAIFESRQAVLTALANLSQFQLLDIEKAAIIAKPAQGETVVVDNELKPVEGFKLGMGMGALMTALGVAQLGIFALPGIGPFLALGTSALIGSLVGGATGQFAALLLSFGFHREQIEAVAESLQVGEVALLMQIENHDDVPQIHAKLDELEAVVLESQEMMPTNVAAFRRLPSTKELKPLPPEIEKQF